MLNLSTKNIKELKSLTHINSIKLISTNLNLGNNLENNINELNNNQTDQKPPLSTKDAHF